jgi:hypothetical protein
MPCILRRQALIPMILFFPPLREMRCKPTGCRWETPENLSFFRSRGLSARQEGTMLDHRILLVSLLLSFLAFSAVPSLVQSPPVDPSAARVLPIEVEPDQN